MRRIAFVFSVLFSCAMYAQTSVTFSHLGNATLQNNFQNPALIPDAHFFIGLPVLSGIHVHFNTKTSYNETFTNEANETLIDIDKMLPELGNQNMASVQVNANIFHIGFKTKKNRLWSFSVNERIEGDILYPKQLVDYLWNGNQAYTNDEVNVAAAGFRGTHFREFGLGYALPYSERLNIGARAKFLMGFADVSIPGDFKATVYSSGEIFQVEAELENFAYRKAGMDIYRGREGSLGSHLLFNSNTGVALDLGATYQLTRRSKLTASVLDLGLIGWKVDTHSEVLNDTTFRYEGTRPLSEAGSIRQTIKDSLVNIFEPTDSNEGYSAWLPVRANASWVYQYRDNMDIHVTASTRVIQRQVKMLYGAGLTRRFSEATTASLTVTKLPQQFVNLGGAFAVRKGATQFYIAADHMIHYSALNAKAIDFRMGMNLMFGRGEKSLMDSYSKKSAGGKAKGVNTNIFLGNRVKTKKKQGVYSIIKKQKKRELKTKQSKRDKKVRTKSLNGRSGTRKKN